MNVFSKFSLFTVIVSLNIYCTSNKDLKIPEANSSFSHRTMDIHSYAQPDKIAVSHLDLDLSVDFSNKVLIGSATLTLDRKVSGNTLTLDSKGLRIEKAIDFVSKKKLAFSLAKEDSILGSALTISLDKDTRKVTILYSTGKNAEALQWLDPLQTHDKKSPFLFTQSQAILARTWIPIQDSPGIRFSYNARIKVPSQLMALMSATNPVTKNDSGVYNFTMPEPIPAYLMALAAGDISFQALGERSGVYSEPGMLAKCTDEFSELEKMVTAAEQLYGQYKWERYDVLVLPPSFPFGGMENPRLTFATPTIIVGDKSLTSLIAHELAHSWSGNLVTNATWNDFWLNEGFTVYFENRIMEKLYGADYSEMLAYLEYEELLKDIKDLGSTSPDTKLRLDLKGRNPDEGVTAIAYDKGYLFLRHIEEAVGRERWDQFVKQYFTTFQFKSMDTEKFIGYLEKELLKNDEMLKKKISAEEWIYTPGLPASHPTIRSSRFEAVKMQQTDYLKTGSPKALNTESWSPHEWVYFINNLPEQLSSDKISMLDKAFGLSNSTNSEIQFSWYLFSIKNNYKEAYPAMAKFLKTVGRRKFILPLYKELAKTPEGKKLGKDVYMEAKQGYHFVARNSIDPIFM